MSFIENMKKVEKINAHFGGSVKRDWGGAEIKRQQVTL